MKVLACTSQYLALVDLGTGKVDRLHEGAGIYRGLTWDAKRIYVAAEPGVDYGQPDERNESLIVLGQKRRWKLGTLDVHGIFYAGGYVWAADTCHDSIRALEVPGKRGRRSAKSWRFPDDIEEPTRTGDAHHVSFLMVSQDPGAASFSAIAACHMLGQVGRVYFLRGKPGAFVVNKQIEVGRELHGLAVDPDDGTVYVASSGTGDVFALRPDAPPEVYIALGRGNYVRGLALTARGAMIMGVGSRGPRDKRHRGDATIVIGGRKPNGRKRTPRAVILPGAGQVYTIRLVDAADHGHHGDGIPCPLAAL